MRADNIASGVCGQTEVAKQGDTHTPPLAVAGSRRAACSRRWQAQTAPRLTQLFVSAAGFSQANSLQESEALVSLLRNPRTFAKVVDILGHNIYCYHAHLNVRSQHAERNRR